MGARCSRDLLRLGIRDPVPSPLHAKQLAKVNPAAKFMGGVKLPLALAELGLIDEYEFVVQPRLVGHGPTLFAGLCRLEAREPAGVQLGGGGDAV